MDRELALIAVRKFSAAIRAAFDPMMVALDGSHAQCTQTDSSDIDVAVIVDGVAGDHLDQEASLYRIRRAIDERIEPVLIESDNDTSGFLRSILKTGEILSER